MKLPAIQFYPADWRKDIGVQSLSFHDRGIWFEMLCVMHESEERGKLIHNGKPMTEEAIARLIGCELRNFKKALTNILNAGVASIEGGVIYNRRMVKDDELIRKRREAGRLGGNPSLVGKKVNQEVNQTAKQNTTPSPSSSISSSSSEIKKELGDKSPPPPKPEPKKKKEEVKEPSVYTRCMDVYAKWFEAEFGTGPKIDGQQGKAMKDLIAYFKIQVVKKFNGEPASETEIDDGIEASFRAVFEHWNRLELFYQQKTKLSEISSNIQNIIVQIKNPKQQKHVIGQTTERPPIWRQA